MAGLLAASPGWAAEAFIALGEVADAEQVVALHDAAAGPGVLDETFVRLDADALAELIAASPGLQRARDLFFEGSAEQAVLDLRGWIDVLEAEPEALAARTDLANLALDALVTLARAEMAMGADARPTADRIGSVFPTAILDPDVYPARVVELFAASAADAAKDEVSIESAEPDCAMRVAGLEAASGRLEVPAGSQACVQFTCDGRSSRVWRLPAPGGVLRFSSLADASVVERSGAPRVRVGAWEPRSLAQLLRAVAGLGAVELVGADVGIDQRADAARPGSTAVTAVVAGGVDDSARWVWLVVTADEVTAARAPLDVATPAEVLACARGGRCAPAIERWTALGGWPTEAVSDRRGIRAAAWVTGGLAVALAGGAAVVEALVADALADVDRCADDDACVVDGTIEAYRSRAADRRLVANIGWGLAGATFSAAVATTLVAVRPDRADRRVTASVAPLGRGAQATLRVRF